MRRKLLLGLAASALLVAGMAAIASAKFDVYRVGDLVVKVDGGVSPKALPKRTYAPVTVRIRGQIASATSNHPAAFRELIAEFDRNGKLNTKGLPSCKGGQLEARTTAAARRVCGKATVGSGSGHIQISFPEQAPIPVNAPITVFNGGTRGGKTTLFIHTYITVPVPSAVVTTVTIRKIRKARYGLGTVSRIPVIAGGSGSVLDFDIRFRRNFTYKGRRQSYFVARCPDGRFQAHITKAIFRNEAGGPRTTTVVADETVVRACRPKG